VIQKPVADGSVSVPRLPSGEGLLACNERASLLGSVNDCSEIPEPNRAKQEENAMPLDAEFLADCPYHPEAVFLDEIVEIDRERHLIRARMSTRADLPLTCFQRVDPRRHPHHVNGGLLVHLTGILGFLHAYYLLELRYRDGWIGVGALIHKARYPNMALIGRPLELLIKATHIRQGKRRKVASYDFLFTQDGNTVYQSHQTAMWILIPPDGIGFVPPDAVARAPKG